jgi:hypothetical protein
MNEELLHFLWLHKIYKPGLFFTDQEHQMEVIHPGLPNTNAGPDFFNAKVKIDEVIWAGNVEIHLKASDWDQHHHHKDPLYDNVILHVVLHNDRKISTSSGRLVPCWEMEIPENILKDYQSLKTHKGWVACENFIHAVPRFEIDTWIERMLIEKLEIKVKGIGELLKTYCNDWQQVFFVVLARNFGFGVNGDSFEQLARNIPWQIILKNADAADKVEALFLGQAGFLDVLVHEDDYVSKLAREYHLMKQKYKLTPMSSHRWKFLRMRPGNFPTIRLVQLAALISGNAFLLDELLSCSDLGEARKLLNASPSDYWNQHYRPGVPGLQKSKRIGRQAIDLLILNTVIPLFFAYGKLRSNPLLQQRALDWLAMLPPEKNSVVDGWSRQSIGIKAMSSAESQGLVYLKKNYCDHKKCLSCRIGHKTLTSDFN